jgi:hypothetical protein
MQADGLLTYDKETQQYEISNKEKLDEMSLPGNYVSLNTNNCRIATEGRYDISHDLGQVKLNCVGNANYNTQNDSLLINIMMIFDFYFENSVLKKMSKDFEVYLNSLNPVPFEGDLFNHGIIELLGKERGDRALSELNLYGNYKKFPDELEKSLVLSDVKLKYNPRAKAYVSEGQIGVGNILKTEIFRYMDGIVQIKKQRSADQLDIYLSPDANTWYYFTYNRGTMLAVSSNDEFNKAIETLKSKSKKMNVEKGPSYRFDIAKKSKKDLFIDKMTQLGAFGDKDKEKEGEEEEPKKEEN